MISTTDAKGAVTHVAYDQNGSIVKLTKADGHTYNARNELTSYVNAAGYTHSFTYDANGNVTQYKYDGVGNVGETIDALGTSALFAYDPMGCLTKTSQHRIDTQDGVDEWEVTLYEFDGLGLITKQVDALGNITTYAYDGNGNLKSMTDWLGTSTFELDPLHQLTAATDHKGNRVEYTYLPICGIIKKVNTMKSNLQIKSDLSISTLNERLLRCVLFQSKFKYLTWIKRSTKQYDGEKFYGVVKKLL